MMKQPIHLLTVFAALVFAAPAPAVTLEWIRQLGTSTYDESRSVAVDAQGNIYICGTTFGSLGGPNVGGDDVFLARYDAAGNLIWTEQLGTSGVDMGVSVAVDVLGGVYVTGYTSGGLGSPSSGDDDAFLARFDASGNQTWTEQLGTSGRDVSFSVATDALGGIYISGYTNGSLGGPNAGGFDAFLARFDAGGNRIWTEQLGTSGNDYSRGIAADGLGGVYMAGNTTGSLGGPSLGGEDAYLTRYDGGGNIVWSRQLGTSRRETVYSVAADGLGGVYITGHTTGNLGGPLLGGNDAFLARYDASGTLIWTRKLGTSGSDEGLSVAADGLGGVYIAGYSSGDLGGPNAGGFDAFLARYDATGNRVWIEQLGTSSTEYGRSIAIDGVGGVYLSGYTTGSLGGPNAGGGDAFLARYYDPDAVPIPEPTGCALATLAGIVALAMHRRGGQK